jgi:hypothetical protein
LSPRVVHDELEWTRDVHLALLLGNFNLFVCLRSWAVSTTVLKDFFSRAEEAWMSVKMYFALLRFVPFSIEKKILSIKESIDPGSLILWT